MPNQRETIDPADQERQAVEGHDVEGHRGRSVVVEDPIADTADAVPDGDDTPGPEAGRGRS